MAKKTTFPERLKLLRHTVGLTQNEFGEKIGKRLDQISLWERSGSAPGAPILTKIQETFNVNLNWLLTGKGEMFVKVITEEEMNGMDYSGRDDSIALVPKTKDVDVKYNAIPDDILNILSRNPELFQHLRRYSNIKQNQAPGEKIKIKWSFEFE